MPIVITALLSAVASFIFLTVSGKRTARKIYSKFYKKIILSQIEGTLKNFKELNLKHDPGKTVFLGDNHVEGFRVQEFFPHQKVLNRGFSWNTAEGMKNRLKETVLDLAPSKIFLSIGTVDLEYRSASPEKIAGYVENIIENVKTVLPDACIHLYSVFPVNRETAKNSGSLIEIKRKNSEIDGLNDALNRLAVEKNIPYIDSAPALKDEKGRLKPEYSYDGQNPNGNAYAVLADLLSPFVET